MNAPHLLHADAAGLHDMRAFYSARGMLATSENADIALIRSHIAYCIGQDAAIRAAVKASRGHTYRVALYGKHDADDLKVRIVDCYDHRDGVKGIAS